MTSALRPLLQMDEGLDGASITAPSRGTSAELLPTSLPFLPTVNQLSRPTVRPALFSDDVSLCVSSLVTVCSAPSYLTVSGIWTCKEEFAVLGSRTGYVSKTLSVAATCSATISCRYSFIRLLLHLASLSVSPPLQCL